MIASTSDHDVGRDARPAGADELAGRRLQDFPVAGRNAIARRAAGGTGASLPLMARQRISLSSKSSIRSYSSKSIFIDRSAPYAVGALTALRSIRAGSSM